MGEIERHQEYPIQLKLPSIAVANRIQEEPAFVLWVKSVLRRHNSIVSKVKKKYWRTTHKHGVRVPTSKSVQEALQLDEINGNTLWQDAINKEMSKAKVSWETLHGVTPSEARKGKVGQLIGAQKPLMKRKRKLHD